MMLEGIILGLLFKDASQASIEETLPELLRLWVVVQETGSFDSCVVVAVCWVTDKALMLKTN